MLSIKIRNTGTGTTSTGIGAKRDLAPLEFVLKKLTGIGNKRTYSQDLVSKRGSATRKLVQKGNILSWNCYKKGTLSFLELVPKGNVLPWN